MKLPDKIVEFYTLDDGDYFHVDGQLLAKDRDRYLVTNAFDVITKERCVIGTYAEVTIQGSPGDEQNQPKPVKYHNTINLTKNMK